MKKFDILKRHGKQGQSHHSGHGCITREASGGMAVTESTAGSLTLLPQVFHRWISYACLILAMVHTFPFIIYLIHEGTMVKEWDTQIFYWTGTIALLFQGWLTLASISVLR